MSTAVAERSPRAVAALAMACSLWGTSFLFAKLAFAELPVSHVVLYRFAMASLVLLPLAWRRGIIPHRRDWVLFAVTGVLSVPVTFQLQFGGLALTTVSSAAIIVGTAPPMLALAAVVFDGEQLGRVGWAAVGLSSLGVVLMIGLPEDGHRWLGDALVFLSIVVSTVWVLMSKRLMRRYPPLTATTYILACGTVAQLPVALWSDGLPVAPRSAGVYGAMLALGLLCTAFTFSLWNWGLHRVASSRAGVFVNLEPLVGVLLGLILLGEALSVGTILGGALILGSAWVVSTQRAVT